MNGLWATIIIGIGLSMDALAISILSGAIYKELKIRHTFRIALFFGFFQAIMPFTGHLVISSFQKYTESYDHWIAFGLLTAIGAKMIYESFKMGENKKTLDPSNILVLLMLSVATSIDALAAGATLSLITNSVILSVVVIGLITFNLSYIGVFVGKKLGHLFENKMEIAGGLILMGLGLKILYEHLFC
ncbi:MAG: manganese efflux pump MntP [Planctomycetota bacterium]|jgi:putative Mn2+ efflux pump MntP